MTPAELLAISREPNAAAFLRVIRACEGTAGDRGYQTIFGYEYFDDFSRHPNRTVTKGGYSSSAAGAYQIINKTWAWLVTKYGFTDFTPETQDAAAVALLIRRNALDDVRAGRLEAAVGKCGLEWASLPGSPYGQPVRSLEFVRRVYRLHGGVEETIANRHEAEAVDTRPNDAMAGFDLPNLHTHPTLSPADNSAKLPIKPMAPLVPALIGLLTSVAPDLVRIFSDKDKPVSERNTEAAIRVLDIAKQVAGTETPAAAVEQIVADPGKQAAFREAVVASWYELSPGDGGGVTGARKALAEATAAPGWAGVLAALNQWAMDAAVVGGGGYVLWSVVTNPETSSDIRSLIIGSIAGYIAAVVQFRYGSSVSSRQKDAALMQVTGK